MSEFVDVDDIHENFVRNVLGSAESRLGEVVRDFLSSPYVTIEHRVGRSSYSYKEKESSIKIYAHGWSDIKVIEDYNFHKHHEVFVCPYSNIMPSLEEAYAEKPAVWFISRRHDTAKPLDCGQYYLIQVNDEVSRDEWKQIVCTFVLSHPDLLRGLPDKVVEAFDPSKYP